LLDYALLARFELRLPRFVMLKEEGYSDFDSDFEAAGIGF